MGMTGTQASARTPVRRAEQPMLLSPIQAAQALNISRAKLYRMIMTGEIRSVLVGKGSRRVSRTALEEFIRKLEAEQQFTEGTQRAS